MEPLEYRIEGKYWYILIDSLLGDTLRKYIDAIVGVTDEITRYELKRTVNPKKPHITIGNGFQVDFVPIRHARSFNKFKFQKSLLRYLCLFYLSM
jgi:hypothetical protein